MLNNPEEKFNLLFSIIFVVLLNISVFAQTDYFITVIYNSEVRQSPSTESPFILTAKKGETYKISGLDSGDWWFIEREKDGIKKEGWISKIDVELDVELDADIDPVIKEMERVLGRKINVPRQAEWTKIIKSGSFFWAYQTSSFSRKGQIVSAWIKEIDPPKNQKELYLIEFNCGTKQSRMLSFVRYIKDQQTNRTDTPNAKFTFVIPETDNHLLMNKLCGVKSKKIAKD